MKIFGYCRISTKKQSIERQVENICKVYSSAEIFTEIFTGSTLDRPQWQKLKQKALKLVLNEEDVTIVFDSVCRMSRNADEGFQEYQELFKQNISLVFLKEPHINTEVYRSIMNHQLDVIASTGDTATDTFINTIVGAVQNYQAALAEKQIHLAFEQAEKEVKILSARTREGMKVSGAAKKISQSKKGTSYSVKKANSAKKMIIKYSKNFDGLLSDVDCMRLIGLSRNTYYKYKRELSEELKKNF